MQCDIGKLTNGKKGNIHMPIEIWSKIRHGSTGCQVSDFWRHVICRMRGMH